MAGRKKRKRERRPRPGAGIPAGRTGEDKVDPGPQTDQPRRSKDELAREQLVPLRRGERPRAVTVAAVVAAVLGLSNIVGLLAGVEVGGETPNAGAVLVPAAVMFVSAAGMWHARYWAVLGFQTILAFLIILMSVLLLRAENLVAVLVALAIIGAAGTLFWFLVKSLARIQMPERRPPEA